MNKITELETQQSLREVTEHFEVDLRIRTFCNITKWLLCFKLINLVVHGNILSYDRIWNYLHLQLANCPGHTLMHSIAWNEGGTEHNKYTYGFITSVTKISNNQCPSVVVCNKHGSNSKHA